MSKFSGGGLAIECFSCSGGMAEGFRRAGVDFDFVFDKDTDACNSYERNMGKRPVQMDVRDLVRMVRGGWSPGPVRLFVADPPCTPWSRAGKRGGLADSRDMLLETVDLIRLLRPEAYLIGNVPGLKDSTQWPNLQRALAPLRSDGYCIADFVTLDAADYGVPQHRVRPFWFGHLAGPCIRWPSPTHCDGSHPALPGMELKPWVTCRDALNHLELEDLGRPVRLRKRACNGVVHGSVMERPARVVGTSNLSDGNVVLNPRHAPAQPAQPAQPAPTLGAKDRGQSTVLLLKPELVRSSPHGHPTAKLTSPAPTIRGGGSGHSAPQVVLEALTPKSNHPISRPDEPAMVVRTNGGRAAQAGSMLSLPELVISDAHPSTTDVDAPSRTLTRNTHGSFLSVREDHSVPGDQPARTQTTKQDDARLVQWPWNRPSTTVTTRDTVPPPGHHPESGSILSQPNAVVLSEKAAAILQGFPDGWVFCGATKRARWSQIGQAMPPALAEAVARSIVAQIADGWARRRK